MKEEALKLADDLEELHEQDLIDCVAHLSMPQASAMIRRLVEELDKPHPKCDKSCMYLCQTKPLSDEEILHIYNESYRNTLMGIDPLVFAREILRKAQEK